MALQIDVISDVVCPWCFIGKRRLERALGLYRERSPEADSPKVAWHPFQLNPDLPESGIDRSEYLERKFGGRAKGIYDRVTAVGAQVGIPFAFDKVTRQPNTVAAHGLIAHACDLGRQDELVEAFFHAYFIDGRDLTSNGTLSDIARGAGLEEDVIEQCLASGAVRESVQGEDQQARHMGVDGVPFFIFNRRYAISGAQEPEILLDTMLKSEGVGEADDA